MAAPVLLHIVRQHAEMAAHLWNRYDHHLLNPDANPDLGADNLALLIEQLEAHLDGLRIAGDAGRKIAQEQYKEFPEAGELFVVRMLTAHAPRVIDLDLVQVRRFLSVTLRDAAGVR